MKRTYCLAATAILFWSSVATVTKLLMGSLTSVQVLSVSALFATVFLLVANAVTGRLRLLRDYRPRDYLRTVLIGLPGTFFYYMFYYAGASMLPASQAFIINYLWPIMSVVFACLLLGERLTPRRVLAILLSFLGVAVVMGGGLLGGDFSLLGALLCVLGAISYGIYTALNQRAHYDKMLSMMFYYGTAFLLTAVINLALGDLPTLTLPVLLGLAYNGILTMAVANTAWLLALSGGRTAKVSNLAYITPFLSLIWTALFLRGEITVFSILGLLVIVLGILLQLREGKREQ
jgi:drug/metabolite transporter (DMT)-like permease